MWCDDPVDSLDRTVLPIDVRTATGDNRSQVTATVDQHADVPPAVRPVLPPAGAPNVVVVLVDDMGFGASTPYGGPCEMPTAERLSAGGLRYTRFHVTSLCSPTRQALLTGRNHHSVGMGVTTEMSTSEPGYTGYRPASAATLAQMLGGNGFSTAAFGKWHQTPPVEVSPSGPFTRWPTGEGFDAFYGFMGAEMNHWYPQLYDGTTPVEPTRLPEDGYHLTEDLVDRATQWVSTQQAVTPDKPFFCYLALGATHAPFHVGQTWIDKYAGRFDDGWDVQRERTLARQKELGVVPDSAELAPWAAGVPHWDDLDSAERRVAARFMETYAGFAEHADVQVGRLVDTLEELGVLEDTLFLYLLGDNGASGEGGPAGTIREHLVGHGIADDTADMDARRDTIGDPTTYPIYPVGWALAMNTPYQWTKQVASHYGGTRDGMIVHWPAGIACARAGTAPVAPRDRCRADGSRGGRPAAPDERRRCRPAGDRGDQPALHLRRPGRARASHHAVLRDGRQPRHLLPGVDRGHAARDAVADGRRGRPPVRGRRVGAVRHDHRLEPGA